LEEKNEPTQVPTDIEGHPLPKLTPEQHARKKELEYERLMKTSNKGIFKNWTREEKDLLITWGQTYDTTLAEFRDILDSFINWKPIGEYQILRSMPKIDGTGRELDVWCGHCGRIHTFNAVVGFRDEWEVFLPCAIDIKFKAISIKISDKHIPLAKWELKWLGTEQGQLIPFKSLLHKEENNGS
jgi:hypothetical protein